MSAEEFLKSGKALKDLPNEQRTKVVCEAAVSKDAMALKDVPLWLRTVRLTRLAVGQKPLAYRHAPHGVRKDYELATFALRRGGLAVWDAIPPEIRDYELCLAGVKGSGALLKVIDPKFRDFNLCKTAFTQGGADLKDVPSQFLQDAEFWVGVQLKHIPDEYKTYDLCFQGVRKCGSYLQYVPDDLKDVILCKAALAENLWAYRYVPERFYGHDFFVAAYQQARATGAPFTIDSLERKSA
jgi:hypothetical protein